MGEEEQAQLSRLLEFSQKGDQRALQELERSLRSVATAILRAYLPRHLRHLQDDIIQETLFKLVSKRYDPARSYVRTWFIHLLRMQSIDELRKDKRQSRHTSTYARQKELTPRNHKYSDRHLVAALMSIRDPLDREVLLRTEGVRLVADSLRSVPRATYKGLAQEFGISKHQVSHAKQRAIKQVAEYLKDNQE